MSKLANRKVEILSMRSKVIMLAFVAKIIIGTSALKRQYVRRANSIAKARVCVNAPILLQATPSLPDNKAPDAQAAAIKIVLAARRLVEVQFSKTRWASTGAWK